MSAPTLSLPTTVAIGRRRVSVELKQFFRDRQSALWNFAFPVILMVIFGSVFGGQSVAPDITFARYFVAGMIASGVFYTAFQNLAIAIPLEREDGTLKRLQGTPMPTPSYFMGKIGTVVIAYIAQVTLLVLVGALFYGVKVPTTATQWFTFVWASILGLTACTLLGIAFSVVPRTGRGAPAIVSPIVLVLQFTSGVFFVFTQLPHWMQVFASFFPLKWLAQAMRSVFLPEAAAVMEPAGSWELGMCAFMLALWSIIGLVLAIVFFRWAPRGTN
ncbi:MAG: ABC transporter permease [Actinomycetales bacterium]|nr:ABC transporter permease [Actinomycetales bacterium]